MDKISEALELVTFVWDHTKADSWDRLNEAMKKALNLAIVSKMEFDKDDFRNIYESFNGGYWFHTNQNGKGMGEYFYEDAVNNGNISACQSYENMYSLKPFIDKKGKRLCIRALFLDIDRRYRVTGFDFPHKTVNLVSYDKLDYEEKGKKKLFSFTNKEWNEFRKELERF